MALRPRRGELRVGAAAAQRDLEPRVAFVQPHDAQRGGLAHHRGARQRRPPAPGAHEALRPERSDLFVVGEQQDERPPQSGRLEPRRGAHGEGQEPLHVAGAAGHPAVAFVPQREGIAAPAAVAGRHDVGVAAEEEAVAVALGTQLDQQVRLGAVGGREPFAADAGARQRLFDQVQERQVGAVAGRVDRDQAAQQLDLVEDGSHAADDTRPARLPASAQPDTRRG